MKTRHYLWCGAAALGFAGGFAMREGERPTQKSTEQASIPPRSKRSASKELPFKKEDSTAGMLPVSTLTIEDLLALDPTELYGPLGLWLLDASEPDMAAFWSAYEKRGNTDSWIKDLVFTQWAKKDPAALLEAARKSKEEGPAWWAWTMSDPDAALAAMESGAESMRYWVFRGIANFHPKRALAMLEENPDHAKTFDISVLAKELARDDPKAGLELLAKYNSYNLAESLGKWAKDDPHQAFQWMSERGKDPSLRKEFIESVMREHPEALTEIAAGLPSGAMKRELENAAFLKLTESDPEKALEVARKGESTRLVAQQLAQVGKQMVADDPEEALGILGELLEKCPDAAYRMTWTRYPNGASGGGGGIAGVSEFLGELARQDPQRTLDFVRETEGKNQELLKSPYSQHNGGSTQVAKTWAAQDLEGFASWCEQQDEKTSDFGAGIISSQLTEQQDFEGAVLWAQQTKDPALKANFLSQTISQWAHRDREAAREWFEQVELPEDVRRTLQSYFPQTSE